MKTVFLKSTSDGKALPHIQLSQPVKPGVIRPGTIIYQINNVPETVPPNELIRLFSGTAIVSSEMFIIDYAQLGIGRILMSAK